MPKDKRPYIKVTLDMPDHPKYAALSRAQKFLIIEGWIHCAKYRTDGVMDMKVWNKFGTKRDRITFVENEVVEVDDDSKTVLFVDYLNHQTSRAEQEEKQEQARSAGQKGGRAKAANKSGKSSETLAAAKASASGPLSGSLAEVEVEEEDKELTYVSSSTHLGNTRAKPRTGRAIAEHLNGKAHSPDAHTIARAYSDSCQTPIAGNTLAKIAQAIDSCLTSGIDRTQIETGIHDWAASPMTAPSTIPDFVHKAANRPTSAASTPPSKHDAKVQGFLDLANHTTPKELE
ncbi:MAG: hypothetical protein WBB10_27605 [Rhodococcus qingshengii]